VVGELRECVKQLQEMKQLTSRGEGVEGEGDIVKGDDWRVGESRKPEGKVFWWRSGEFFIIGFMVINVGLVTMKRILWII
jgi:hypothetical protein